MNRALYLLGILALLSACTTKSIDYYISHESEAFEKVETCKQDSDNSEECVNAFKAVLKIKQGRIDAKRLAQKAQRIAEQEAYEKLVKTHIEELRTLPYKEFIKFYNDSSVPERQDAADRIYQEVIEKEVARVRAEIGDENIPAYKKKVCAGITMDQPSCDISKKIEYAIDTEAKNRRKELVEHYLSNREELRTIYNWCGVTLYEKAGLPRDGKYVGALGFGKITDALNSLAPKERGKCEAAKRAAQQLNIEYAEDFTLSL
ncbi:MAG: EexN family lipoprotein [Cycloclasticus sp.]|jgi:hypothetical protein|nr:EexN family lipoprotein [Cycloclasticus sp.]